DVVQERAAAHESRATSHETSIPEIHQGRRITVSERAVLNHSSPFSTAGRRRPADTSRNDKTHRGVSQVPDRLSGGAWSWYSPVRIRHRQVRRRPKPGSRRNNVWELGGAHSCSVASCFWPLRTGRKSSGRHATACRLRPASSRPGQPK